MNFNKTETKCGRTAWSAICIVQDLVPKYFSPEEYQSFVSDYAQKIAGK